MFRFMNDRSLKFLFAESEAVAEASASNSLTYCHENTLFNDNIR